MGSRLFRQTKKITLETVKKKSISIWFFLSLEIVIYLSFFKNSYCLDKNDRGEESEEEIWEGEDQGPICPTPTANTSNKAATVVPQSAIASSKPTTVVASSKTSDVKDEEEDYGGSTEVDEVDTEDEIEM